VEQNLISRVQGVDDRTPSLYQIDRSWLENSGATRREPIEPKFAGLATFEITPEESNAGPKSLKASETTSNSS
jgi:hypothetical protein